MSTWIQDLKNSAVIGVSIKMPTAARTTAVNGDAVDLRNGTEQCFGIVVAGTMTDSTVTITVEESKNANAAHPEAADPWAAVSPAPTIGTIVPGDDDVVELFVFHRRKRYVRAVGTPTGATTGGFYSVLLGSMKQRQD